MNGLATFQLNLKVVSRVIVCSTSFIWRVQLSRRLTSNIDLRFMEAVTSRGKAST